MSMYPQLASRRSRSDRPTCVRSIPRHTDGDTPQRSTDTIVTLPASSTEASQTVIHKRSEPTTATSGSASASLRATPGAIPLPLPLHPCVWQPVGCVSSGRTPHAWYLHSMSSDDRDGTQTHHNANGGGAADEGGQGDRAGSQNMPRGPAPLSGQQAQLAALLSFKPSSRDVISGIAPHVFDDQRSPRRPRPRRRNASPDCRPRTAPPVPRKSPLRLSAVISVDDHSVGTHAGREDNIVIGLYTAPTPSPRARRSPFVSKPVLITGPSDNKKPKRRGFGIERVFRTLIPNRK
ncbi:hypothetical protein B0H15DRAFT_289580 [Mycena belliarum]|uniref:Uncharacterized protein n=1 Tax=Mycena belliarum TaxID=1033014 RepID=A0AAD6U5Y0_9AGAR|nr:hypothetical protein B0H15DRAFT_289580 [Mycena belliae]